MVWQQVDVSQKSYTKQKTILFPKTTNISGIQHLVAVQRAVASGIDHVFLNFFLAGIFFYELVDLSRDVNFRCCFNSFEPR